MDLNTGNTPKRARIKYKKLEILPSDPLAFEANKSSKNARKIISITENLEIDIWFDQHYFIREQHGDQHGKREGIDQDLVRRLVIKSIPHLLLYSASVSLFTFLNKDHSTSRAIRVVLQEDIGDAPLNVVIEAHFVSVNYYEITVKTAICKEEFLLSDGQYSVEINGNNSTLRKREKNVEREISFL